MANTDDIATIRVKRLTHEKFLNMGNLGDTADTLLNKLIDCYLKNKEEKE